MIVVTAVHEEQLSRAALASGAAALITKSINLDQLAQSMEAILGPLSA